MLRYRPGLNPIVESVRPVIARHDSPAWTARKVADILRATVPTASILTIGEREAKRSQAYVLHAEHGEQFSIVARVLQPWEPTPIHDHLGWAAHVVIEGVEQETRYTEHGGHLVPTYVELYRRGEAGHVAPPHDIHFARNVGDVRAVSLHVYGVDVRRHGTSIRRMCLAPVLHH